MGHTEEQEMGLIIEKESFLLRAQLCHLPWRGTESSKGKSQFLVLLHSAVLGSSLSLFSNRMHPLTPTVGGCCHMRTCEPASKDQA